MNDTFSAKRTTIREKMWHAILRERGREVNRALKKQLR
jgi:hypothetical protein